MFLIGCVLTELCIYMILKVTLFVESERPASKVGSLKINQAVLFVKREETVVVTKPQSF